jgi:phosphoglycolate phosphatase (TIGR01487 family)
VLKALLTDVDGTLTDPTRMINTGAIEAIRQLIRRGVRVVLASGNTACFMDALCRMIGTDGTMIGENGGVYRIGFFGSMHVHGDQQVCLEALGVVKRHFSAKGEEIALYGEKYRYADVAFARTVPVSEVAEVLAGYPVRVLDTSYAIHLQALGVSKGTAFLELARELDLDPADFMAFGDSVNDIEMLRIAGIGVAVGNAHPDAKAVASYVAKSRYGDGFTEAVGHFSSHFPPEPQQ